MIAALGGLRGGPVGVRRVLREGDVELQGIGLDGELKTRRQDTDDFAFFVVRDGTIEDKVISIHLTFAKVLEVRNPLRYPAIEYTFIQWLRKEVIPDVADSMSEVDMHDE